LFPLEFPNKNEQQCANKSVNNSWNIFDKFWHQILDASMF